MSSAKPSTRKPATRKPAALITIVADEAVLLWDAMTDRSTTAKIRKLLPDRIQLVARPPRPVHKPAAATVPAPHAVRRAAA
jgi:hypothetical protein